MNRFTDRPKKLFSAITIGACFWSWPSPALADHLRPDTVQAQNADRSEDTTASGSSGLIVHIDPQTGRTVKAPAGVPLQLTPSVQNAMSTSHQGLVVTPSPVPGGGLVLHLRGRFQQPLLGTIDDRSVTTMRHLQPAPDTSQESK